MAKLFIAAEIDAIIFKLCGQPGTSGDSGR